ncbi:RING finger and transmembrane domain-containing protein 2 [Caerostris darwini]|uniref:RING finger and transmembrane domain-containing protein 2 n=1 Tax=Caerostris darwini TaxID=1538125 RepID=A0AAV4WQ13_9ARAC|nr:RING finger and transmembrane domain-containing protein 2 [Caerostris darwini]
MAEGNRLSRTNRPRLPWSIQQIHENSQQFASTATQHIHDLHDYVLQGLTPLITSSVRSGQNSPSRSPWFDTSETVNTQPRNAPTFVTEPQENFVIDIEPSDNNSGPSINAIPLNPDLNDPNHSDAEQGAAVLRNSPELQALFAFAEKYVPFILILLLKLIFDHRIGILVNLGLFITFCHANAVIKREVAKQGKRRLRNLFLIFINLITSIFVIYTLLADHTLAYALVFIPPYSAPIDFWDVLWIVSVTDFVLRLITVLAKIFVVSLPAKVIAYQKKGKYYLFIERSSQLYRTVTPMQHWLYFFSESYSGPSKVFGVILSAAYLIFKVKSIFKKAKLWKKTLIKVIQSKTYGVTPSTNQIKEAGDACPICQDDYKSPSMLQCKHIFCEECVALWFDRERTCPICRAQIADDPTWRDGSTTLLHQIF